MDERTRQTISNIFRSMENNSRNWIVNRKFHPLDRFSYLKTRYRNYWRLETNFRASFAQSVSIKKRFCKKIYGTGMFLHSATRFLLFRGKVEIYTGSGAYKSAICFRSAPSYCESCAHESRPWNRVSSLRNDRSFHQLWKS